MIYVAEHHDALLPLWRRQDLRGIRLAHVDFHDDLRGLLVDRRRGRAYPIGTLARQGQPADPGNFLAHAVLERRLERIRWIHDWPGGRAWDVGIVRYESDLAALPRRLRHALSREEGHPLQFAEILMQDWRGVEPGERLSVDWDCFASILQDRDGVRARVESFLASLGAIVPEDSYVVYSPEYVRQDLAPFRELVSELGRRFTQPVEWLSPGLLEGRLNLTGIDASLPHSGLMRLVLFLRRRGIY